MKFKLFSTVFLLSNILIIVSIFYYEYKIKGLNENKKYSVSVNKSINQHKKLIEKSNSYSNKKLNRGIKPSKFSRYLLVTKKNSQKINKLKLNSNSISKKKSYSVEIDEWIIVKNSNNNNTKFDNSRTFYDGRIEWEILDDTYYFKKSAAYYFKDFNLILIYFVSKKPLIANLKLKIQIFQSETGKKIFEINLKNTKTYKYRLWRNLDVDHGLYSVKAFLKIEKFKYYLENNKLHFRTFPYLSNQIITKNPINLKIKKLKEESFFKKEAMICTKMFFLKKEDFSMLERWFTINENIGFDKIVLYNNSIPNTAEFNNLFYKYKYLVELKQMQYFPDIINNSNNFLKEYFHLYDPIKKHCGSVILFQILNYNECYLDNIDKYKYIAIFDIDETIIPRPFKNHFPEDKTSVVKLIEKFKKHHYTFDRTKNYECQENFKHKSGISSYIIKLRESLKISNYKNIYFQNAYYMSEEIIKELFSGLEEKFITFKNEYIIQVKFKYKNLIKSISFKISTYEENEHLKNLYNIYKKIFVPYFNQLKKKSEIFDRFFYIENDLNVPGKSIYTTSEYAPITSHHLPEQNFVRIPYSYGHSSHFRRVIFLKPDVKWIQISDIYFDSNFLKCYLSN